MSLFVDQVLEKDEFHHCSTSGLNFFHKVVDCYYVLAGGTTQGRLRPLRDQQ